MAINWKGVFPAVTTKFTSNDTLDLALFTKNIEAQIAAGVNGIILEALWVSPVYLLMQKKKS